MGFSVSGATAVLLIGGLIAFSFAFSAMNNGYERVSAAQEDRQELLLEQANAEVTITNTTYDPGVDELTVRVNNTGSTGFLVGEVSVLVDGTYRIPTATGVAGTGSTDVWLAGEQLVVTLDAGSQPDRVKIVTGTGSAATTTEVTASG